MYYKCQKCQQTYEKSWAERDAIEEYRHRFPDQMHAGKCVVCDDCYQEIIAWVDSLSPLERQRIEASWH